MFHRYSKEYNNLGDILPEIFEKENHKRLWEK